MTQSDSIALKPALTGLQGVVEPRIRSKPNDLPSKGQEMIDFVEGLINPDTMEKFQLTPAQKFLAIEMHKVKPDGRWYHTEVCAIQARQNGKSTFMALRIITGMFLWGEKLQVATAHKLTTSSETFYKINEIIQTNPELASKWKKNFESKGSQEIRLEDGTRYLVRANNSAARGIARPSTIHMDEVREYHSEEVWASLRYTQMASENPMVIVYSNAGDQHSIVLNKLRERGIAASMGADDTIGYFEWSAPDGCAIDDEDAWRYANPSLGWTIHPDNLRAAMKDDESIVRTELLCQWVNVINPAINPAQWADCFNKNFELDPNLPTWMAIDLSPSRKEAALVAAQRSGEKFGVVLLHTWSNEYAIDDKAMANEIAGYVRKYETEVVAFSSQTAGAVAARLAPGGINTQAIDGALYGQSCDEMQSAITSQRLMHLNQEELNKQMLSAVKLPFRDGGWYLGRKVSNATICASVATAMVSHFATRGETEIDIIVI